MKAILLQLEMAAKATKGKWTEVRTVVAHQDHEPPDQVLRITGTSSHYIFSIMLQFKTLRVSGGIKSRAPSPCSHRKKGRMFMLFQLPSECCSNPI